MYLEIKSEHKKEILKMTNNVEKYFDVVRKYRHGLDEINKKFDELVEAKKCYAGSVGFETDIKAIEEKRAAEIAALREDCGESFDFCIAAMQKAAQSRLVTAPTEEQLRILETLKMREKLTRDDLVHASNAMSDCPLALGVLEELARKHEILGFRAGGVCVSDQFVADALREFSKSARITLSLARTNQRAELMRGTEGPFGTSPAFENISKFRLDIDPESAEECAARWGGVSEGTYVAFCKAVNPTT